MRKEEKMEIGYKAVQVATGVPIWNLFEVVVSEGKVEEKEVGSLTDFPNEGPMATVRFDGADRTVSGATFDECLAAALEAIANLEAEAYDDDIEDEGNDIAYMRHLENKAMDFAMSDPSWVTSKTFTITTQKTKHGRS
jgi:hypothetical protein